jgi:hypothetical protein
MRALTKLRIGLTAAIIVILLETLALVGEVYAGSFVGLGMGLLSMCVFIVYVRGLLQRDMCQARRAYNTYRVVWLLCIAMLFIGTPVAVYDLHQTYNASLWECARIPLFWLGGISFSTLLLGLLRLGITGLGCLPDAKPESGKAGVLWWALLPVAIMFAILAIAVLQAGLALLQHVFAFA